MSNRHRRATELPEFLLKVNFGEDASSDTRQGKLVRGQKVAEKLLHVGLKGSRPLARNALEA